MRIVLQHATSGLYLKELGVWTADLEAAQNFGSSHRAIKFLKQQRLTGVQVLVAFLQTPFLDTVALHLPGDSASVAPEQDTRLRPAA